jgi:hypothetical protein
MGYCHRQLLRPSKLRCSPQDGLEPTPPSTMLPGTRTTRPSDEVISALFFHLSAWYCWPCHHRLSPCNLKYLMNACESFNRRLAHRYEA